MWCHTVPIVLVADSRGSACSHQPSAFLAIDPPAFNQRPLSTGPCFSDMGIDSDCGYRSLLPFRAVTGEVVHTEPIGWKEAVGLDKDDLQAWEGPTEAEVAKDVAVEVGCSSPGPRPLGTWTHNTNIHKTQIYHNIQDHVHTHRTQCCLGRMEL